MKNITCIRQDWWSIIRRCSKCMPALLYRLEACPFRLSDYNSLDFVVNRFFMKLFKTNNLETVTYCRTQFNFDLPSTVLKERSDAFVRRYVV